MYNTLEGLDVVYPYVNATIVYPRNGIPICIDLERHLYAYAMLGYAEVFSKRIFAAPQVIGLGCLVLRSFLDNGGLLCALRA